MSGRLARRVSSVAVLTCLASATATAAGDPRRGEKVFQKCYACHSVEPGEVNLPGPNLAGIIGRAIAAEAGFDYSPALRDLATREKVWTADLLDRFVAAPEEVAPGTQMSFPGLAKAADRADLLAYLGSASDR